MKWNRAEEVLPEDGVEIIIRQGASYFLGTYNSQAGVFKLRTGRELECRHTIWAPLPEPPRAPAASTHNP